MKTRTTSLLLVMLLLAPAVRAEEADGSDDAGRSELSELVSTLKDPEEREKLVARLELLLEAERAAAGEEPVVNGDEGLTDDALGVLDRLSRRFRETLGYVLEEGAALPGRMRSLTGILRDPDRRAELLVGLLAVFLLAGGAVAVMLLAGRLLRWPRRRLSPDSEREPPSVWGRTWQPVVVALLDLVPVAALVGAGFLLVSVTRPGPEARLVALLAVGAIAVRRGVGVLIEAVLQARSPRLRSLPLGDERATGLTKSLGRLLALGVYGYFAIRAAEVLGADASLSRALRGVYGILLLVLGVVFVLRQRGPASRFLASRREERREASEASSVFGSFLLSVAGIWWVVALLYLFALWTTWASGLAGGFEFLLRASGVTAAVVLVSALALGLFSALLSRLQRATTNGLSGYPQLVGRVPSYYRTVRIAANAVVGILAASLALEAWGVAAIEALRSEFALTVLSAVAQLLLIYLLAVAVIDVATVFTQRYLTSREVTGKLTAKARTLVPLIRSVIKVVVVVIASIMALSEIGVDIGPILAGVGMLGLAIGFGAQTLVKDIITGFFILLEDSIRVGDVANLAGQGGLVEAVNLRTVRLRDLSGNVHVIPYSAVGTVTNMTKDFSFYLVEAGVAYREDTDEVVEVMREVLEEMRGEAPWSADVLEPLEVLGVDRFTDSAVIVRARIKTKPIRQWATGREYNRRLKKAFDARGIEIPFPHRTIWMGKPKEGSPPELPVRLNSAGEASEE